MPPELQTFRMLPAGPGKCAMCAKAHGEREAHDYFSLFYQMRFRLKYSREATHGDSVAHMTEADQRLWQETAEPLLAEHNLKWNEPSDGRRIAEPVAINE